MHLFTYTFASQDWHQSVLSGTWHYWLCLQVTMLNAMVMLLRGARPLGSAQLCPSKCQTPLLCTVKNVGSAYLHR